MAVGRETGNSWERDVVQREHRAGGSSFCHKTRAADVYHSLEIAGQECAARPDFEKEGR